jgi:hypothetical protein
LSSQQIARVIWQVALFIGMSIIVPVVLIITNGIVWFFSLFYTPEHTIVSPLDGYGDIDLSREYGAMDGIEATIIPFLAVVIAIILTVLIYIVLKAITNHKQLNKQTGIEEERNQVISIQNKKHIKRRTEDKYGFLLPRNPRMTVRYHYRQFLRLCIEKGSPIKKGDTSEEINVKNVAEFSGSSMSRLRELYIKARYSEHEIKKSDSKEAGELVKNGLSNFKEDSALS